MPWNSWLNAEIYDRFVQERPIYRWLNRHLVELADVEHGLRLLDLGCGTGATTLACLNRMPVDAEIVGIDASESMVELARSNVRDPRASFEVLPAGEAHGLPGRYDRVVSNAAFWQFPSTADVFRSLAQRTGEAARVVFNVPASRVVGQPAPIDPFQVALMAEIETETGAPFTVDPILVDPEALATEAASAGFELTEKRRLEYVGLQKELMELMTIPAMIGPLTPDMSDAAREAVLQRAAARCEPGANVVVPWIYFLFRRSVDGRPGDGR